MTRRRLLLIVALLWPLTERALGAETAVPESATHFQDVLRPVLVKFCGDCHDPADKKNPVRFLSAQQADDLNADRGLWHSVAEQLRNRTMPPPDEAQPSEAERLQVAAWIEATLRATACQGGEFAGVVLPRRLNRFEYERTIRDLLGVEFRASESFPVDGSSGEGFNNNGEALYLPPILLERYLEAASTILDQVIVSPPVELQATGRTLLPAEETSTDRPRRLAAEEEATALVTIYIAGDYDARITARSSDAGTVEAVLKVDGLAAETWKLPRRKGDDTHTHDTSIHLTRGVHAVTVRNGGDQPIEVATVRIASPRRNLTDEQRERHRRLLLRAPGETPTQPREAARDVLASFTRRAFRRPVDNSEVERFLSLYDRAAGRGDPWEESLKLALKGVLVSPHFLFRVEADPQSLQREPLSDHELAVRLSYFLWSSQPDEELTRLADAGRLHNDDELRRQVDRMLDDPRAIALAEQFIGQWLGTHEVGGRVIPSTDVFEKQFTEGLLNDLRNEPVHFFAYLLRENRSLLELLDCDYAIINERLSRHYGYAPDGGQSEDARNRASRGRSDSGGPFVRVALPDDRRGGVLGMGAVHMLTSYPDRTSPVLRGGWVLETLLDVHVPSPPPDVPQLKRDKQAKKSLRDQLARHRENPTCAACHNLMDPLGFALENFDVLGRWRDQDGEVQIDASASLPSGETFAGPAGLRQVLLARQEEFLRQITRKLLGYALGRSLEDADDCTVQKLTEAVHASNDSARALVHAVVQSTPFRYKQLPAESTLKPGVSKKPGFSDARVKEREDRDRRIKPR